MDSNTFMLVPRILLSEEEERMNLSVSGSGYAEVKHEGDSVYVHRLAAVAEYGFNAVADMDVHHMELFDGCPCQWLNARDAIVPEDPVSHRSRTLNNVAHAVD
jgi:hypothetical protein